jgi:ribosome-binding factor A
MARRERTTRMRRVDTALRQVLAEAVARELSDPRLGFVTITRVEATQDSREAKVWFSTLRPRDREASQQALESARGLLQSRVAAELKARHTPQLTFHYDSTQQDAARLSRLIDEVTSPADGTGA